MEKKNLTIRNIKTDILIFLNVSLFFDNVFHIITDKLTYVYNSTSYFTLTYFS